MIDIPLPKRANRKETEMQCVPREKKNRGNNKKSKSAGKRAREGDVQRVQNVFWGEEQGVGMGRVE